MRGAAQCTHGVGGCQLKSRRTRFGRRDRRATSETRGNRKSRGKTSQSGRGSPRAERSNTQSAGNGAGLGARSASHRRSSARLTSGGTAEGTVSAHRAGYGFVRVEGAKESVFLPPRQMRGLMHGDRVRVSLARDASDRWLGEVEEVLGRGVSAFLGTVEITGRQAWVNAADR